MPRLKAYLRNSTSEERLSGPALMQIHKDIVIGVEHVLQQFDTTGHTVEIKYCLIDHMLGEATT